MKQRILYIAKPFLLLLVFMPVMAVCLLQYRQLRLQRRGKEKLEKELLQTITVPANSLQWAKPGKEIWVNNHLFDVKSYILKGDFYEFRGLFDVDETLVVNSIRQQDRQQTNTDLKIFGQLFKLLQSVFHDRYDMQLYCENTHTIFFPAGDYPLNSLLKLVNTPPPRC